MIRPQFLLPIHHELVVDLFAGGGGASTGIEQAIGRPVDIAVNHDPEAVSLHCVNHPQTRHFISDVFEVDPLTVTSGQPVGLLWASPDCTFHSKARGGKPFRDRDKARRRRGLAGVVIKWAAAVQPRVICLENVEEFQHWGPLLADGTPCPDRRGQSFKRWVAQLRNLGYRVEWQEMRGCDYGAPTIRKRLFLVARRDGLPIVWPTATHAQTDAKGKVPRGMKPWRTAAECIDWSIPVPSIFERKKPLADATCRRIAKGIVRYVIQAEKPFIAPNGEANAATHRSGIHQHGHIQRGRGRSDVQDDFDTDGTQRAQVLCPQWEPEPHHQTGGAVPLRKGTGGLGFLGGISDVLEVHGRVPQGAGLSRAAAFLAKHYTGVVGTAVDVPTGTVTTADHHSLVTANLIHMGHGEGKAGGKRFSHGIRDVAQPLNTITASGSAAGLVCAFLSKYCGNEHMEQVTVTIAGQAWAIVDIGLRMLSPRELYRAQGFPDSYVIDHGADGEPFTKAAQVRMCGNSVCPPMSCALVNANYHEQQALRLAA